MARRSDIQLINQSREFLAHELFFSVTNEKGVIEYGNEVFVRISDYAESEIVGAAHSIVRHPDMPRAVFQLFWEKLKAGEPIAAYVKNLARDGRYYWVMAVACPCKDGFLSVRLKPTSPLLTKVAAIYRELCAIEHTQDENVGREALMGAARKRLLELLNEEGFDSYEAFMQHALSTEMASRKEALRNSKHAVPAITTPPANGTSLDTYSDLYQLNCRIDANLNLLFERLDDFQQINKALLQNSVSMLGCASNIQMLAINATVAAKRIAGKAATLDVVAQSLGNSSSQTQLVITQMLETITRLVDSIDALIFEVATVKLQTEVTLTFLGEILSGMTNDSVALRNSLRVLQTEIVNRTGHVYSQLGNINRVFVELREVMLELYRNNQTLRFVQISGKKETATIDAATGFAFLLRDVEAEINKTERECSSLNQCVGKGVDYVQGLLLKQHNAKRDLDSIRHRIQSQWETQSATAV